MSAAGPSVTAGLQIHLFWPLNVHEESPSSKVRPRAHAAATGQATILEWLNPTITTTSRRDTCVALAGSAGSTTWSSSTTSKRRRPTLVAAAATVRLASGNYESARLAFSGVADVPTLLHEVSQLMVGEQPSRALWGEVGRRAALAIEPTSDAHASTEDRRDLMRYLTLQVLEDSTARALHPAPLSGRSRVGSDPLQLP